MLNDLTKADFRPRTAEQAARAFGRKVPLTSEAFEQLTAEAKQQAYRIAGLHKIHVVQYARDVVHRAIRDSLPFAQARRELLERLDVEGLPRIAIHRLRTMFCTNVQQAHNDGRREELDDPEMARMFPYRQYLTVGNGTPGYRGVRPEHARLHGKVFAWNDPFWDDHTPPWGFNCRCYFRPLTAAQVKRMGVRVISGSYVRKRLRIRPQPGFVRGGYDVGKVDEELRAALQG